DAHACALAADARAFCWGGNGNNERGDPNYVDGTQPPSTQPTPFAAAPDFRFDSITAAHEQVCGLTADGRAICWGHTDFNRLGAAVGIGPQRPMSVLVGEPVRSISIPFETDCAVSRSSQLY